MELNIMTFEKEKIAMLKEDIESLLKMVDQMNFVSEKIDLEERVAITRSLNSMGHKLDLSVSVLIEMLWKDVKQ